MPAIYKVSYVVSGEDHPGAILNSETLIHQGDVISLGSNDFEIIEVIDLVPPRGDFHYLHATLVRASAKA
ncbi:MAG: hypothetical protein MUO58_21750 [Anaerolineales bacterium]|jgi:hypothetical protein|nr:hypothetical protein [Anaerolineales bacterium]